MTVSEKLRVSTGALSMSKSNAMSSGLLMSSKYSTTSIGILDTFKLFPFTSITVEFSSLIDVSLPSVARSSRILISFKSELASVTMMTVESSSLIDAFPDGGACWRVYIVPVASLTTDMVVTSKESI